MLLTTGGVLNAYGGVWIRDVQDDVGTISVAQRESQNLSFLHQLVSYYVDIPTLSFGRQWPKHKDLLLFFNNVVVRICKNKGEYSTLQ